MKSRVDKSTKCGKKVEWSEANRARPFCSERCRVIDLGAWATESYRIPVQENKDDVESEPGESQQ